MGEKAIADFPFESPEHYQTVRLKLILYFERRKCGCPEDLADDCLHRVFLCVKTQGMPDSIDRFVFGFASNVFLEWLRESGRRMPVPDDLRDREVFNPASERSRQLARRSIEQLDEEDRELMEQYYLDCRSAESLAAEWGLSPGGVRSRVFRKRRQLLKFFMTLKKELNGRNEKPLLNRNK